MATVELLEQDIVATVEGRLSRYDDSDDKMTMADAMVRRSVEFIEMFEGPDAIEWKEWIFHYEKIDGKTYTVVGRKCMMTPEAIELDSRWPGERIDRAIAGELKHRGIKSVPYPKEASA